MNAEQKRIALQFVRQLRKLSTIADDNNLKLGNGGIVGSLLGSMADELEITANSDGTHEIWRAFTSSTRICLIATLLLVSAATASADSIWSYQGQPMNGCSCSLTGSVTLNAANQPISWDFTDGTNTLTELNSSGAIRPPVANPQFFPGSWYVNLSGQGFYIFSEFYGSIFEATDGSSLGGEQGHPGFWTDPVATPEPSPLLLLALVLSLVAMGFVFHAAVPQGRRFL